MSRAFISKALRDRVAAEAHYRCGYCQAQQAVIGITLHIEHIIPLAAGGSSEQDNLWVACASCNNHKGTQTHATDPVGKKLVSLFNPRTQAWRTHFAWATMEPKLSARRRRGALLSEHSG